MTQWPAMSTSASRPRTTSGETATGRTPDAAGSFTADNYMDLGGRFTVFVKRPPRSFSAPAIANRRDVGRDALQRHFSLVRRLDKPGKQRMRAERLGLELGVELH